MISQVVTVPLEYRENDFIPLEIKSGALFDALLYVSNDYNEDVDEVYISDGAWGQIINDYENVEIEIFDILDQGNIERKDDTFFVERGLHFKGTIQEDVVFFRHLKPGGMPVDLSGFDYLSFNASGKGDVRIRLESMDQRGELIEKIIRLEPTVKRHTFSLAEFSSQAGFNESQITAISFLFDAESDEGEQVELLVEHIFFGKGQPVSEEEQTLVPREFSLSQNYPNPFVNSTTLEFEVPEPAHVQITIYDLLGREVFDAVDQEFTIGKHTVQIDGDELASGMYVYKMAANDQVFIQTMHVVR